MTRCTDRFVRYPYPKSLNSSYKKNFLNKAKECKVVPPKQAFNLEREKKTINPHKMECKTTHKESYTGAAASPNKKKREVHQAE